MISAVGRGVGRIPHLPALDGIRALAVSAVLLYHGEVIWTPGGFLGVEVFFVLSGFLITALLLEGKEAHGRIDLKRFWVRRARRLLPALFLMLFAVTAAFVAWWPEDVTSFRAEVPAAVGYVSNWYQIGAEQSYFESLGRPSPFQHLWSLGIEEQFYIVWPVLLGALLVVLKRPRWIAAIVLGLAAVSSLAMWALYSGDGDPTRVYFGTDTRAAGLLLGAALAVVWRPWRARGELRARPWALDAAAAGAGAVLVWAFMRWDEFAAFTYRPGIHLVALATMVLVAVAVHPRARAIRLFSLWPLQWLGRRSYSIYLWHWPVFVVTRPGVDLVHGSVGETFALRIGVTLALAEVSYRFVEEPIRRGALGTLARRLRARAQLSPQHGKRVLTGTIAGAMVMVMAVGSLANAVALKETPLAAGLEDATPDLFDEAGNDPLLVEPSPSPSVVKRPSRGGAALPAARPAPIPNVGLVKAKVIAVGDSVMQGARTALKQRITNVWVETGVSRQVPDGLDAIRRIRSLGKIKGRTVVVHLGNNGRFTEPLFDEMMRLTANAKKVVVLTVKVPRRWERSVNKVIYAGVKRHPRAELLDWNVRWKACPGKAFASDGYHLTTPGARCYAKLIAAAL